MKKTSHGFVLIIVLVLLQMIALLSFYELQNLSTTLKLNDARLQQNKQLHLGKAILHAVEQTVSTDAMLCRIPITPFFVLNKQSLTWWQEHACGGNLLGNRYDYVIELLEANQCGVTRDDLHRMRRIDYYRITVLLPGVVQGNRLFQSTVAEVSHEVASCETSHVVTAGQQMWREI